MKKKPILFNYCILFVYQDKARIPPTGVLALYLSDLTNQILLKAIYLTDDSQREIKIGNRTIVSYLYLVLYLLD